MKQGGGDVIPVDMSSIKAIHFAAASKPENPKAAFRVQLSGWVGDHTAPGRGGCGGQQGDVEAGQPGRSRAGDRAGDAHRAAQRAGLVAEQPVRGGDDLSASISMWRFRRRWIGIIRATGSASRRASTPAASLCVHAYCKLTYDLDGTFKAFRTQYAMADIDANNKGA